MVGVRPMKQARPFRAAQWVNMQANVILSTHDVAEYCGVSPRTVLRWVDAGVLPGFLTGGGRRRISRDDLLSFMRGRGMPVPPGLVTWRDRVAIIDDDTLHTQLVERHLNTLGPALKVQTAADGFAAGAMLFSFRPHLVFLDLVMPGLDGFEVCRRIRSESAFEGTGVVVITAHVSPPVRSRLLELGADEVISKPFRREDLSGVLARFVPEGMAAPTLPLN